MLVVVTVRFLLNLSRSFTLCPEPADCSSVFGFCKQGVGTSGCGLFDTRSSGSLDKLALRTCPPLPGRDVFPLGGTAGLTIPACRLCAELGLPEGDKTPGTGPTGCPHRCCSLFKVGTGASSGRRIMLCLQLLPEPRPLLLPGRDGVTSPDELGLDREELVPHGTNTGPASLMCF